MADELTRDFVAYLRRAAKSAQGDLDSDDPFTRGRISDGAIATVRALPLLLDALEAERRKVEELEAEVARHHRDFTRWEEMAEKGARHVAENAELRTEVERLWGALRTLKSERRLGLAQVAIIDAALQPKGGGALRQRLADSMERHKPILDRLAEEGGDR